MKYINESKYACQNPLLLQLQIATTSKQYKAFRFNKKGERVSVMRYENYRKSPVVVRCGKCPSCRKLQNDTWYCRLYHQYLSEPDSKLVFITLTFNEEEYKYIEQYLKDIPIDQWHKDDYTPVFRYYIRPLIKRLRAKRGENLEFSYYCVSERGERYGRFHFHLCLFWRNHSLFSHVASEWNIKHPYSKHYVKTKRGLRLQTDLESYLQHIIERQFSSERFSSLEERYIFERHGKSRRITSKGSYGNVTLFIADGVGMLKYVTNYMTKCQHDGYDTYHRQSRGLGKKYASEHLSTLLYDDNLPFCYVGNSNGHLITCPTPRTYFRWFGDKQKQIDRFWSVNSMLVERYLRSHTLPKIGEFG